MEWPILQVPFIGNRLLIAIIGTIHVSISHGMAVGGSFFVVLLHHKSLQENNLRLGQLTHKLLRIFFIITTSVGALTGVGIWFVTATVSPATIGSLLHVFFWAWFTEWLVFLSEVILIMLYYLGWSKYGAEKAFKIGQAYVFMSWLTMMIISGILGAMLTPGKWLLTKSFWDGFFNPSYLPQLLSRTALAALLSICFGLLIIRFYTSFRDQWPVVWRVAGKSMLIVSPLFIFAVLSYYHILPQQIEHLIASALMTTKYAAYAHFSKIFFISTFILMMVFGLILLSKRKDYGFISFVPIFLLILALGNFERVREYIRKPYTIHQYLYSNGIREAESPFLNKNGVSEFTGWAERTAQETDPVLRQGEKLFKFECSMCHTHAGINGIIKKTNILQSKELNDNFLKTYKRSHPYMPPFVGTDEERMALATYLDKVISEVQEANPVTQENTY